MMNYIYPAVFEKNDDGYTVSFPDLKGCITEGDTIEEAYQYAKEALTLYLDGLKELPNPSKIEDVKLQKNETAMLVEANISDDIEYF